jgi:hypothetical protein
MVDTFRQASILFLDHQKVSPEKVIGACSGLRISSARTINVIYEYEVDGTHIYVLDADIIISDVSSRNDILSGFRASIRYLERYATRQRRSLYHVFDPAVMGYPGRIIWTS